MLAGFSEQAGVSTAAGVTWCACFSAPTGSSMLAEFSEQVGVSTAARFSALQLAGSSERARFSPWTGVLELAGLLALVEEERNMEESPETEGAEVGVLGALDVPALFFSVVDIFLVLPPFLLAGFPLDFAALLLDFLAMMKTWCI